MPRLPDVVKNAWEDREGAVILTTVDTGGIPNAIFATCVTLFDGNQIVIANNFKRAARHRSCSLRAKRSRIR